MSQYFTFLFMFLFFFTSSAFASIKVRIPISSEGIYRIGHNELQGIGIDVDTIDPVTFQMTNKGEEIAIRVHGEGDHSFDSEDYIEFYAVPLDTIYTETNVYWLSFGDEGGKRIAEAETLANGNISPFFKDTLYMEENHVIWNQIPTGEDADLWYWVRVRQPSAWGLDKTFTTSFYLNNIVGTNGTVTLALQGRTDCPENPDHHTQVYVNGVLVSDKKWNGMVEYLHIADVSNLKEGRNTVTMQIVEDLNPCAPNVVDTSFLNWIEVEYKSQYKARGDVLKFQGERSGDFTYEITDFSSNQVNVFDISNPFEVKNITPEVGLDGESYEVRFHVGEGDFFHTYLASGKAESVSGMTLKEENGLRSATNGADCIIITYDAFYDAVLPLAEYRKKEGLRTVVAKMSDLYDEFNDGIFSPEAIRNFLIYAYKNWLPPRPRYVLLVGDATYDYRNYLDRHKDGAKSYVPCYNVFSSIGRIPSDNWFVGGENNDGLPLMAIGRLPVRTVSQVNQVISKILDFEEIQPEMKNALFVADNNEASFANISNQLAEIASSTVTPQKVYNLSTNAIYDNINNKGTVITSYIGHGGVTNWAGEFVMDNDKIRALNNKNKYPFVVTFDCINGLFYDIDTESMAEVFVNTPNKGAIAAWAPTGGGLTSDHEILGQRLFKNIFEDKIYTLGDAVLETEVSAYNDLIISREALFMFTFFGDPATHLRINPPDTPSNKTPNEAILSNAEIEASEFSSSSSSHSASHWQITSTSGNYSSPIYDSGANSNLEKTGFNSDTLEQNTAYYWRVRYRDANGTWSLYSGEASFTTSDDAEYWKGVPKQPDSDHDDVIDGVDECPDTLFGIAVDDKGCPTNTAPPDADNDGVVDHYDDCPDTATGEEANNAGCSDSQLDDDNDGVKNNVDLCLDTPLGVQVYESGCTILDEAGVDSDEDGVIGPYDKCPNTPGVEVGPDGCPLSEFQALVPALGEWGIFFMLAGLVAAGIFRRNFTF